MGERLGRLLALWVAGALILGFITPLTMAQVPSVLSEDVRIIESNETRILLEIGVPDYVVTQQSVDGQVYDVISIPGYGETAESGHPQLPVTRLLLGIPLDAEIQVQVLDARAVESGPYIILPAPDVTLVGGSEDVSGRPIEPPQFERRYYESPEVYGAEALYPGTAIRLGEVGFIRSQRFAALDLFPIQYNPATRQAIVYSNLTVELSFSYPAGRSILQAPRPESGVFEDVLRSQLLNYTEAKEWRGMPPVTGIAATGSWPILSNGFKIFVEEDGLYRLTYDQLRSAGVSVDTLDPRTLQMFYGGQEIAIRVIGEGDGVFGEEDYVLFFGQGIRNKYTEQNVYWLTYGQVNGLRMLERNGHPSGEVATPEVFTSHARVELDPRYTSAWPGSDSYDRWFYHSVYPGSDRPIAVELSNVAPEAQDNALRVALWGFTSDPGVDPDHHAQFYVNDQLVGEHTWDGDEIAPIVEFDLSSVKLNQGTNILKVYLPGDTGAFEEGVYVDYYEMVYGHTFVADSDQLFFTQDNVGTWRFEILGFTGPDIDVYDISMPSDVVRITNIITDSVDSDFSVTFSDVVSSQSDYLALSSARWLSPVQIVADTPSNLHDSANGADYIVISHANFMPAAEALAQYRATQGLRTKAVDVGDVYDEFGYGLPTADAIRDFLRYAYERWQPPSPAYVVLLGDGTYDPKDHRQQGVVNYLSPYLAYVDQWLGETAADNRYASIVGEDPLPDMFLGRLPANSLAEAMIMVDKTKDYELNQRDADWNSNLAFVADIQPDPLKAGDFHTLSNKVADLHVPPSLDVTKIYLGSIPGSTCDSGGACRQQLLSAINDAGMLLVNYVGHGSVEHWSSSQILNLSTITQMTNGNQLPIMLPMTCVDGYYIEAYAGNPCVSESIVRAEDSGAVASWGPTGLGVAYGHEFLDTGFLDAVFKDDARELGVATYAGKMRLYQAGSSLEQIEEYTLFGDPALHINAPDPDLRISKTVEPAGQVEPGDTLTYTLTFSNASAGITAHHVVLTDVLDLVLISPTVVYSSPDIFVPREGITYAWDVVDLVPGVSGEIQLRAVVSPDTGPTVVVNEANLYSPASQSVVSVTTGVQVPDMSVEKVGPESVTFDQAITYTIAWGNTEEGRATAHGVRLTDIWPPWVWYEDDSSGVTPAYDAGAGRMVWDIPYDVPTGTFQSFVLTGWVTMDPGMVGPLVNQVRIESDLPFGKWVWDRDTWTSELLLPDLAIQAGGPAAARPQNELTFTVTYSNAGDVAALNAVITDVLPPSVSYVRDDSGFAHSEPLPGTHVWRVAPAELSPGEGGAFDVVAQMGPFVEIGAEVTHIASIGADTPDPVSDNDMDWWSTLVMERYFYYFPRVGSVR